MVPVGEIRGGAAKPAIDAAQAKLALRARVRFGHGMEHGGRLNFGDVFSYALAKINIRTHGAGVGGISAIRSDGYSPRSPTVHNKR